VLNFAQNRRWLLVAIVVGLVVVVFGGIWIFKTIRESSRSEIVKKPAEQKPLPRMANLPPKETAPVPPPPSYSPNAPVLEQARKALSEGIDPTGAVALAESLPDRPERADAAFLLLEYAADEGHAKAAMAVGQFYDPSYGGPSGSIRKNPATAYDWYQEALSGGYKEAGEQLERLRKWVQEQAEKGSRESQELLKTWR
jgi:hypothetical protein